MRPSIVLLLALAPSLARANFKSVMDAAVNNETHWYQGVVAGGAVVDGTTLDAYQSYYARPGTAAPNLSTAFRLGSVTKAMVGFDLAMQNCSGMYTGGTCPTPQTKTLLQDRMWDFSPSYTLPTERAAITIEQLATHTSGLPRTQTRDICQIDATFTAVLDCSVGNLGPNPMNTSSPGTCIESQCACDSCATSCNACTAPGAFLYSNWGFNVLGHLLAFNAGYGGWWDLDKTVLLTPLGMSHTFVSGETTPTGITEAIGYDCDSSGSCTANTGIVPLYLGDPAGGLWSTGPDMLNFVLYAMGALAFPVGSALPGARALVFTEHANNGNPIGLGWMSKTIAKGTASRQIWWKSGDGAGFHAEVAWMENPGGSTVGAFAMTNGSSDEAHSHIVEAILRAYIM